MPEIHPSAVVDPNAQIADDVKIGPFCVVGPNVKIGAGTELISQCSVLGRTTIGKNNKIFPTSVIGAEPQDYNYKEIVSYVKIGNGNVFREGSTVNAGAKENSETIIGNDGLFMINSHVAHDCQIGNNVILVNGSLIAGHVHLADGVIISGASCIHQFCRVGRLAFLSGVSAITMDLPPFMIASERNKVSSVNLIGLKRSGASRDGIRAVKDIFKIFYKSDLNVTTAIEKIKSDVLDVPEKQEFIDFVQGSERGVLSSNL